MMFGFGGKVNAVRCCVHVGAVDFAASLTNLQVTFAGSDHGGECVHGCLGRSRHACVATLSSQRMNRHVLPDHSLDIITLPLQTFVMTARSL
jgi:hypothetical protein